MEDHRKLPISGTGRVDLDNTTHIDRLNDDVESRSLRNHSLCQLAHCGQQQHPLSSMNMTVLG